MTCPRCNFNHASDDARAIGRFGPTPQYVAKTAGTPRRATREEAEADECAARQQRHTTPGQPADESEGLGDAGPVPCGSSPRRQDPAPFPAATMETAARAKAWRDFLTQLRLSLMAWEVDPDVRAECEPVLAWLNRCRDDLNGLGAAS